MPTYETEQEAFWAGTFGEEYARRNRGPKLVGAQMSLFSRILCHTHDVRSAIEFGANIGLNMQALRGLLPDADLSAIEINSEAVEELRKIPSLKVYHQSILEFTPDRPRNFVFTKGVLIHINPDKLAGLYERLYTASDRYICVAEYYNPSPVALAYRGAPDKLFKRDFAGEILDRFKDLRLIDYGFAYHRDPLFPQDDLTWFLMEKRA